VLASKSIADKAQACVVQREFGTSDHGPVVMQLDNSVPGT
jgi:exonuclease III